MSRQIERLERYVDISNEALAVFVGEYAAIAGHRLGVGSRWKKARQIGLIIAQRDMCPEP